LGWLSRAINGSDDRSSAEAIVDAELDQVDALGDVDAVGRLACGKRRRSRRSGMGFVALKPSYGLKP
jgi:hypothetical protein